MAAAVFVTMEELRHVCPVPQVERTVARAHIDQDTPAAAAR
ncbi:hypothetical protein PV703_08575 [Streptomyces sp. ME01-24h]|nr:hypothetical protein [Streptomyces sp. ME01-24h]